MKCRCTNIITMMCLTLVLIGFTCDVARATDAVVGDGTPASCTQEAFQIAVNNADGGTVTFKCGPTATINVTSPIVIGMNMTVTIDGGGNKITIDGGDASRLFQVNSNGDLTLKGLTLENGYAEGNGGAVLSFGKQLTIENSTLAYNYAAGNGGAIWSGFTTLTNSTVTDNGAGGNGGAIWIGNYSLLRLNRATVSGNAATGTAGGVFFDGYNGSSLIWYDSILADNSAGSYGDCYANGFYYAPVALYSILGPYRCGIENNYAGSTGNIEDVSDPILGTLGNNGGPTPTMLPLLGSPAIHKGNPDGYSWGPSDQRGYPRTYPYDIGAVETCILLNPIGNKTIQATKLLAFTVTASAPDGDTLTYSATSVPAGATFDPATHTFQWQPTGKQTGNYQVTFTVTDNEMPPESASETITITVTGPNRPPVFNPIPKYSVVVSQLLKFTVSATDPDGNSVIYSLSNLPTGATLEPTTGLFQWTPSTTGVYKVTFTATDNGVPAKSSSITTSINVTKK
jgi:hypothetical protein